MRSMDEDIMSDPDDGEEFPAGLITNELELDGEDHARTG